MSPDKEIDVYNFLHLVNSSSKLEDMGTSCLGADIDDLDQEDEYMAFELSPEREDKPTFDEVEFGGDVNGGLLNEVKRFYEK